MARTDITQARTLVGKVTDYILGLDGLTAYYPLDETEGTVATDSKSGLNGNINNLNRLANGNMEGDYGWEDYSDPTVNERSTAIVHGGTYSRHTTITASGDGARSIAFDVVLGHTYRVSGWVYAVSAGAGRLRRNAARLNFTLTGSTTGEWEFLTADVVCGETGTEQFRLEGTAAGDFYFDDCSVVDLADVDNTIVNNTGYKGQKAYLFDGVNDYTELPQNAVFSPATTGEFTFFALIRPDELVSFNDGIDSGTQGVFVHLLGKSESGGASEFVLRLYDQSGSRPNRVAFYVFEAAGGEGIGGYFEETLTTGGYIFVTGTVDGQYISIYRDGVLKQKVDYTIDQGYAGPLTLTATDSPVRFGTTSLNTSDNGWFEGAIQHLGFLNRAMTAEEIAVLNAKVQSGLGANRTAITQARTAATGRTAIVC